MALLALIAAFLSPSVAVAVGWWLNRKVAQVHEIVNGQHSALEALVDARDATITRMEHEAHDG
jgi:hypothetical protein